MKRSIALLVLALLLPAAAVSAQGTGTSEPKAVVGEKYWIEFTATFWRPALKGSVQTDDLDVVGSRIDLASDLALDNSQALDLRLILRPAKKHRFRLQYTPNEATGDGFLTRDITIAGEEYPVSLPVHSFLSWRVLRVGYEWDFFYRPRGFVGVVVETGFVNMRAGIDSLLGSAEVFGEAPLVAVGLAGRFYPIPNLAIHMEGTGLTLTNLSPENEIDTLSLDFSATYNFTRNFGVAGGWRRNDTRLKIDTDQGDVNFRGFWLGGTIRY